MPAYTIYEKPELDLESKIDSAHFVPDKFSYFAFLLPMLWLIVKRLWWALGGYIIIMLTIELVAPYFAPWAIVATSLLLGFLIALEAPSLIGWHLRRKGYREYATLFAEDSDHCTERYIRLRIEEANSEPQDPSTGSNTPPSNRQIAAPAPMAQPSTQDQPVLGLFPTSEKV